MRSRQILKEFEGIEYEIKFDVVGTIQNIEDIAASLSFPARFVPCVGSPQDCGTYHFFGRDDIENLVIMEQDLKYMSKEKKEYPSIGCVLKRCEKENAISRTRVREKAWVSLLSGNKYMGCAMKNKIDIALFDSCDGRMYTATVSFTKVPNSPLIQKQVEIEYTGYVRGYSQFVHQSESQITETLALLSQKMKREFFGKNPFSLVPTTQRRYDFVKSTYVSEDGVCPLLL